ncbi:DUF4173 domain-containing protein [Longimicrobium sp.]|uniref:DUF4153 domain-containing protein n=1 Tax=Longimicrobium sp. TaxID=2029185 RepID=UPI002C272AB9|nr:DUF4173 domain-containing protein [Longimicrobium sp.]HSU13893.1 DUF4173 domain-containing protein [Longimicrobium sp.]
MSESVLPAAAAIAQPPVSTRTRHGLGVAAAALALGALGDGLLRPVPWGLNIALWTAALVVAAASLQRWAETEDAVTEWIPVALSVSALMAWRDSPTLKMLDLTALFVVLGLAVYRSSGGSVRVAGLARYCAGLADSLFQATFGAAPLLFRDVKWGELPREGWTRHALSAARGVAIALPLLLLFGSLLMAADAAFDSLVSATFNLDVPLATSHIVLALVFAWVAAGVLRGLVLRPQPKEIAAPAPSDPPSLGIVEVATVLGLLDLLFLAFVVLQLPHFFGSYQNLLAPGTGTFSEYARRGFFELCAVATLVLPLLIGMHWVLRRAEPRAERVFRIVAGVMVGLVFVIIASGLHRMGLYLSAYGLTELRVYTTAFMLWLAAVLGWFAWTVLRGRRERFAFGALTAGVEMIVLLHVASPDALIVRVNASRHESPVRFDALYAASLSGDAVPGLLARLDAVPADGRCAVAGRLLRDWSGADEDWRAWSLGRARAVQAVHARAAALRAMCPARVAAR